VIPDIVLNPKKGSTCVPRTFAVITWLFWAFKDIIAQKSNKMDKIRFIF
jgi:hypothetical protein